MRAKITGVGIAVFLMVMGLGLAQWSAQRGSAAAPGAAMYRVVPWPDHKEADRRYTEELEEFLNRMANEGWRYHSEVSAQPGRMMVFERANR